jgi:hypothetical protein
MACDCPIPGIFKECHCRAARYNVSFQSDDWCSCFCHRPLKLIAYLGLEEELQKLGALDPKVETVLEAMDSIYLELSAEDKTWLNNRTNS